MPIMRPEARKPLVIIYGQNGSGKTSLACMAPKPLFICVDGRSDLLLDRAPTLGEPRAVSECLGMAHEALEIAREQQSRPPAEREYRTLVIDELSAFSTLSETEIVRNDGKKDSTMISACGGFGKAFGVSLDQHHVPLLSILQEVRRAGMMVVVLCQAGTGEVDNPTFDQALHQWQPLLRFKGDRCVGSMWCDAATVLGFLTVDSSFKAANEKTGQLTRATAGDRVVLFDGDFRFRAKHGWFNHEPELPADETFWSRLFIKPSKPDAAPASE